MIFGRRTFLKNIAVGASLLSGVSIVGCGQKSTETEQVRLKFISGPPESIGFAMGSTIGTITKEENREVIVLPEAGKSLSGMAMVGRGELDLATGSAYVAYNAMKGEEFFTTPSEYPLMQVTSWYWIWVAVFAPVDSDIYTIHDLEGKKVGPGPLAATFTREYQKALSVAGVKNVEWVDVEVSELAGNIRAGIIDAGGGPANINGIIPSYQKELISSVDLRLVGFTEEDIKAIEKTPGINGRWVPNEVFGGVKEFPTEGETFVLESSYCIYSNSLVKEETIYNFLNIIWDNKEKLPEYHKAFKPWTEPDFWTRLLSPDITVHPGAARFFKEKGIWRPELKIGSIV